MYCKVIYQPHILTHNLDSRFTTSLAIIILKLFIIYSMLEFTALFNAVDMNIKKTIVTGSSLLQR